jgi:hypothetical protein
VLPNSWIPHGNRHGTISEMMIYRDGSEPKEVVVCTDLATYALEAELVADSLPAAEAAWPAMSHADALGNMRVLDRWRAALHDDAAPT